MSCCCCHAVVVAAVVAVDKMWARYHRQIHHQRQTRYCSQNSWDRALQWGYPWTLGLHSKELGHHCPLHWARAGCYSKGSVGSQRIGICLRTPLSGVHMAHQVELPLGQGRDPLTCRMMGSVLLHPHCRAKDMDGQRRRCLCCFLGYPLRV